MQDIGYIGYRIDPVAKVKTSAIGVVPVASIVSTALKVLPSIIPFFSNVFASPAKDAREVINALKGSLIGLDARTRLGYVLAATQKISTKAKDVEASELIRWYRQAYPEDYKQLTPEDKIYWNNFCIENSNRYYGQNTNNDYLRSMFTDAEINFNSTPITAVKQVLTNKNNLLLIGGGILALLLLLKK